jgi:uncharacterized protein YcnI
VSRLLARLGVIMTMGMALLVGGGSVANAHVTVHADKAVQGGSAEIAFRAPTESDTARTVKVQVALPTDTPIAKVSVLPLQGWSYRVKKTTLPNPVSAGHGEEVSEVVGVIEWSVVDPDAAPGPGEYQVFRIAAGPLPKTDRLIFKVVQSYEDGQVQRWIDQPADAGSEPEHPAPVLALAADSTGHHGEVATLGHTEPLAAPQATTPGPAWWAAVSISLVALIAALAAVLVSVRTVRRKGGDESPA